MTRVGAAPTEVFELADVLERPDVVTGPWRDPKRTNLTQSFVVTVWHGDEVVNHRFDEQGPAERFAAQQRGGGD